MGRILMICILMSCVSVLKAQSLQSQDSIVNQLVERHKAMNVQKKSMAGYRIQIYFGGDRAKAINRRLDFLQQYPEVGAYVSYKQPNFRLRVGDFKTRIEAVTFLNEMLPGYAMAFIVADEVKLPVIEY